MISCILALLAGPRPVGEVITTFRLEQGRCIERVVRVGEHWLDDETLWVRVAEMEECE